MRYSVSLLKTGKVKICSNRFVLAITFFYLLFWVHFLTWWVRIFYVIINEGNVYLRPGGVLVSKVHFFFFPFFALLLDRLWELDSSKHSIIYFYLDTYIYTYVIFECSFRWKFLQRGLLDFNFWHIKVTVFNIIWKIVFKFQS